MWKICYFEVFIAKYLVKQWNTYYAEMRILKDVAHVFGQAKFCDSLQTASLEEVEIIKLPHMQHLPKL